MTDTSFEDLYEIACKELAYSRAQRDQLLTAAKLALEEFRHAVGEVRNALENLEDAIDKNREAQAEP